MNRHFIGQLRVAGIRFHHYAALADEIDDGDKLQLERDPQNEYDANAIKVHYVTDDGRRLQIGFVEKEWAPRLAAYMDTVTDAVFYALVVFNDQSPRTADYNRLVVNVMAASPYPDFFERYNELTRPEST